MHLVDDGLLHVPLYGLQHRALRGGRENRYTETHIYTFSFALGYVGGVRIKNIYKHKSVRGRENIETKTHISGRGPENTNIRNTE